MPKKLSLTLAIVFGLIAFSIVGLILFLFNYTAVTVDTLEMQEKAEKDHAIVEKEYKQSGGDSSLRSE